MSNLLAIDPGLDTGWALVDASGRLLACGLGENFPLYLATRVVIERPQVYQGRQSKGDPNDLITLAIRVGRYTERLERQGLSVEHVFPKQWKGTVDADVLCRRVYQSLSPADREVLDPVLVPLAPRTPFNPNDLVGTLTKGKRHNVIDGVGIARWSVGSRLTARFNVAAHEACG